MASRPVLGARPPCHTILVPCPSLTLQAYVNELAGILVESDNPGSQATQVRTCAVDAARLEPPGGASGCS